MGVGLYVYFGSKRKTYTVITLTKLLYGASITGFLASKIIAGKTHYN